MSIFNIMEHFLNSDKSSTKEKKKRIKNEICIKIAPCSNVIWMQRLLCTKLEFAVPKYVTVLNNHCSILDKMCLVWPQNVPTQSIVNSYFGQKPSCKLSACIYICLIKHLNSMNFLWKSLCSWSKNLPY